MLFYSEGGREGQQGKGIDHMSILETESYLMGTFSKNLNPNLCRVRGERGEGSLFQKQKKTKSHIILF